MKLPDPPPARPENRALEQLARDGFAVLRRVIPRAQAERLRGVGERLLGSRLRRGRETQAEGWDSFRGAVYLDDRLAALIVNPRLVTFAVRFLGPNLHLMSSQLIRLVPTHGPRKTRTPEIPGWHRDIYGLSTDVGYRVPCCAIKVCLWLSDTHLPELGGTMFARGSHFLEAKLELPPGASDPPSAVEVPLRAGDAIAFDHRTFHAGGRNSSDRDRWCIMLQYGYRWLARVDPLRPRPALMRAAGPVARQLMGARDTTTSGRYVAGLGGRALAAWSSQHGVERWVPRTS